MSNLKKKRKELGMSQALLASKSGVSIRMIQYYEQGAKDINKASAETIYLLSKALNCRMEEIIDLDKKRSPIL